MNYFQPYPFGADEYVKEADRLLGQDLQWSFLRTYQPDTSFNTERTGSK
jgi:hypothetical protein